MSTKGKDNTRQAEYTLWGVDLRETLGYSTIYAMILALCLFTDAALRGSASRVDAIGYFIPLLAVIFALNVSLRASGITDTVVARVESPVRLNVVLSIVLGIAWVLL